MLGRLDAIFQVVESKNDMRLGDAMATKLATVFFAYPSQPVDLAATISAAAAKANGDTPDRITTWQEMNPFGSFIPDKVRETIRNKQVFVFDVTKPNKNVYYEAGFAIGLGKPVAPVVNVSFAGASTDLQKDGLFDNIGYQTYENADQLLSILEKIPENILVELYSRPLETQQPLFVLDTLRKTDFRNYIVSAVKRAKVFYRSFDPVEVPRFSAVQMIADITASSGIVIPILNEHIEDAERHNLRAAFLAGLCHGLDRYTLLVQNVTTHGQNPADYREMITPVSDERVAAEVVVPFAQKALEATQSIKPSLARTTRTALQRLSLGASAAENEFRTLANYFVQTSEFIRTRRGEVNVVAGRKGAGKTAIFFQVRDEFRQDKSNIICDLKPESHQLHLFREELSTIVNIGALDHTIAAFWYFLFLSEIILAIRDKYERNARFDGNALKIVGEINKWLRTYQVTETGDFTTRINRLVNFIVQEIEAAHAKGNQISPDSLTGIIFRGGVTELKSIIQRNTDQFEQIVILFDNIDKGWPTSGVEDLDVRMVRLLIESLDKLRRDFNAAHRNCMTVVFLRNDIYELMVQQTPDRGKAGQVRIDWTDRAKLKQVIYKRMQSSLSDKVRSFDELWTRFFPRLIGTQDSFEFFVDHCLMRPRFLINIIENAISNAINRGHESVIAEDCIDAVKQHSLYLIDDFGYEIRDVSGLASDLLYSLVGADQHLSYGEFVGKFIEFGLPEADAVRAFDLMLWYGVIGIQAKDGAQRFIYDYEYNMKRLQAEARAVGNSAVYVTNPAIHLALN
ncbi:P-loop ATPase, Sll1717 family [Aquabacter sp. P-9]|uniref:P-loop ATPase, Sll1717 family n=1 Tax=Aquabacter sediminis TaxID=3029197 RepID=UPI00237D9052|nr:hypothetical protein [Aquabacter sp. P-9]MDE1570488.1 hypothetical protein [Aquabacter sp. P-9]